MKYVVTALLAIVCIAGVGRWFAERIADRRHRGLDHDRRHRQRDLQFEFIGRHHVSAVVPVTLKNDDMLSGLLGHSSRHSGSSRTVRGTGASSH